MHHDVSFNKYVNKLDKIVVFIIAQSHDKTRMPIFNCKAILKLIDIVVLQDVINNNITIYLCFIFIVEHFASILTGVLKAIHCSPDGQHIFRLYILTSLKTVFTYINYSLVVAIILKIFDCFYSLAWNFMDLLIIILACALTDKFKQLNQKLESVRGKVSIN